MSRHAIVAFDYLAFDHHPLLGLPIEDAQEIAAAAMHQADLAFQAPEQATVPFLPDISAVAPQVVRLHARA